MNLLEILVKQKQNPYLSRSEVNIQENDIYSCNFTRNMAQGQKGDCGTDCLIFKLN